MKLSLFAKQRKRDKQIFGTSLGIKILYALIALILISLTVYFFVVYDPGTEIEQENETIEIEEIVKEEIKQEKQEPVPQKEEGLDVDDVLEEPIDTSKYSRECQMNIEDARNDVIGARLFADEVKASHDEKLKEIKESEEKINEALKELEEERERLEEILENCDKYNKPSE